MNAERRPRQDTPPAPSMKKALMVSAGFHVGVFVLTLISLPFVQKEPLIITPVSVELVDVSDVTRTTKVAPPKKKEKEKEIEQPKEPEVKKPAPTNTETPPDLLNPKPPEPEKPEEKPKEPEPPKEPLPEPKPEKPKEKEKPKDKPKEKPKPPAPKKEDTKKQEQDFQSLLKNLTPDESKPKSETENPSKDGQAASGQIAQLGDKLTISELDAFRRQIEPCWYVPAGAEYAENLAVQVRVIMRRDMTVQEASVLDTARYTRDSAFRAAADAALRALRSPSCQPLKLPPDKYDQWKVILINFDPSEML